MENRAGRCADSTTAGESVCAFIPAPLPSDPKIAFTSADYERIERANRALGRLDGVTTLFPNPSFCSQNLPDDAASAPCMPSCYYF